MHKFWNIMILLASAALVSCGKTPPTIQEVSEAVNLKLSSSSCVALSGGDGFDCTITYGKSSVSVRLVNSDNKWSVVGPKPLSIDEAAVKIFGIADGNIDGFTLKTQPGNPVDFTATNNGREIKGSIRRLEECVYSMVLEMPGNEGDGFKINMKLLQDARLEGNLIKYEVNDKCALTNLPDGSCGIPPMKGGLKFVSPQDISSSLEIVKSQCTNK